MLAQAQITPIFVKGHLYSGSHWVRVLRAAELVVSLATGRDPPASAYKLNCLFRKSLQHVYFFKTFCSFLLIGQFQIRFCIIATTYNVERCKKYKCLLKFIVHVFWVLENSNRNVGQWKLLGGLVGGKEGRKDYAASNAQAWLPCHCNPHILTSCVDTCANVFIQTILFCRRLQLIC